MSLSQFSLTVMPLLEQFNLAGQEPGLQVWRIENLDLVPVPSALYGQFFTGDCYIVMYTFPTPNRYNVHAWIGEWTSDQELFFSFNVLIVVHFNLCCPGSESSQDESAAAAIIMVQLDQHLNNFPTQFIDCQGSESTEFHSYFKKGILYKVKQHRCCCIRQLFFFNRSLQATCLALELLLICYGIF